MEVGSAARLSAITLDLEKLVNLRNRERVELMHGLVDDRSKTGYVTEQLLNKRDGAVLVFVNHSDDVVDAVMS
jgi:hypothetical protein